MISLVVEVLIAPALVGFSTFAGWRWSTRLGGLISAFPAVIGPVLLISAHERGEAFAAHAANGTMLGLAALGAFVVTYGWVALRAQWWVSVVLAWVSAALLGVLVGWSAGGLGFPAGLCVAILSLTLAYVAMPASQARAGTGYRAGSRKDGVAARMMLTAVMVVLLATTAELFGPLVGGMLAALPILTSILAVFTHHQEGSDAVVQLLRGMLTGMAGFVGFCAVMAVLIVPAGVVAAFGAATAVAIGLQALAFVPGLTIARQAARL